MAENPETPPPSEVEPDQLFRLQVAVSDFLFKHARKFGVAVVVALLGVGVFGGIDSWRNTQREKAFGAIATIDHKMPEVDRMAEFGFAPADDPSDPTRLANVTRGAELYEEAARKAGSGTTAAYAWLKAASTWDRLKKQDQRLAALEAATKAEGEGLAGLAAIRAYSTALLDAGRSDDAIKSLRDYASSARGFYAEEALIALAAAQVAAGKAVDAQAVVEEFQRRFKDSPRAARLGSLVPAPAPTGAPAPPAAEPAPGAPAPASTTGG